MRRRATVALAVVVLVGILGPPEAGADPLSTAAPHASAPVATLPGTAAAAAVRPQNFATDGDFVDWAYERTLAREPDPDGLAYWVFQLALGLDPVAFLDALLHSPEHDDWTRPVLRAFRTAYGRAADLAGLRYWSGLRLGPSLRSVLPFFLNSPEHDALYAGTSDAEYVRRIYANALGRIPDPAGHQFWTAQVAQVGRAAVLWSISESPEHRALRHPEVEVTPPYASLLDRLPDNGGRDYWEGIVRAGGSATPLIAGIWQGPELASRLATVPSLQVTEVVGGLAVPWGLAVLPDGSLLFTQRHGVISLLPPGGARRDVALAGSGFFTAGEGGLLDLVLDPGFASNNRFYTCQNREIGGVRDVAVYAWTLAADRMSATRLAPLVTGLPATSGRHSGCRILPDPATAGVLYVATGDAAIGTQPQDLTALGGKVLRVSATDGSGVAGNPFITSGNANSRRIFNYGHRNLQGLAHRPGTGQLWTAEHGPDRDDEVNLVLPGLDYGWNPVPGYNEAVPMTRVGAQPAVWSSGPPPAVAPSGMAFLDGCSWGALDDHFLLALLRGARAQIHGVTSSAVHHGLIEPAQLNGTFGRLRTVVRAPDGTLLITTSNGSPSNPVDRILRVTPVGGKCWN
jgi:aldose sugar dehydrogenase